MAQVTNRSQTHRQADHQVLHIAAIHSPRHRFVLLKPRQRRRRLFGRQLDARAAGRSILEVILLKSRPPPNQFCSRHAQSAEGCARGQQQPPGRPAVGLPKRIPPAEGVAAGVDPAEGGGGRAAAYCSSWRTPWGCELAWASIAWDAWRRMLFLV